MEDREYLVQQCIPMGSFAQYALTTEMRLPVLIATPRRNLKNLTEPALITARFFSSPSYE